MLMHKQHDQPDQAACRARGEGIRLPSPNRYACPVRTDRKASMIIRNAHGS